jgi:hypothetical protein
MPRGRRKTSALTESPTRSLMAARVMDSASRRRWGAQARPNDKLPPGAAARLGGHIVQAAGLVARQGQLAALRAGDPTTATTLRAWIIPGPGASA